MCHTFGGVKELPSYDAAGIKKLPGTFSIAARSSGALAEVPAASSGCAIQAVQAVLQVDLDPSFFLPFLEALPGASDWTVRRWKDVITALPPKLRAESGGEPLRRAISKVHELKQSSNWRESVEYYWDVSANEKYFSGITPEEIEKVREAVTSARSNPYDVSHMIGEAGARNLSRGLRESQPGGARMIRGMAEFEKALASKLPVERLAEELNRWIDSPERAVYFYSKVRDFGGRSDALLVSLSKQNRELARAKLVNSDKPSFVTLSFEKESKNPKIADFYISNLMNESGWAALSPEQRFERLFVRNGSDLKPLPAKPRYLGPVSHDAPMLEVKSALFELDRERLLGQMRELSEALNESHSFHAHLVSDFPVDYAKMSEFNAWHKQLNDYLTLAGMEEGIHPAGYIELTRARSQSAFPKSVEQPESFARVNAVSHKMQSAGLRAMYGESHLPGHKRIGIELRDVSRRMESWDRYVRQVGSSLEDRVWEKAGMPGVRQLDERRVFRLRSGVSGDVRSIASHGIGPELLEELLRTEPNLAFPFLPFESSKYLDYGTGKFIRPSEKQVKQLDLARKRFVEDLRNLETEIQRYRSSGERLDPANHIQPAIRMSLTEWARRAKVSALLSGI